VHVRSGKRDQPKYKNINTELSTKYPVHSIHLLLAGIMAPFLAMPERIEVEWQRDMIKMLDRDMF